MKLPIIIFFCLFSLNSFTQDIIKSDTVSTLKPEVINKILSDSRDGGLFDFWTPIKGHEYDGALIQSGANPKDNVYATNREIAVIKWSYSLSKMGVKRGDIIQLYEKLKARKIRNDEITLIDFGIKKVSS